MIDRKLRQMIKDVDFKVVTLSPAIGKRLADKCGIVFDNELEGKIVEMLYQQGVDCILNLAETSEYSIMREADLFLKHIKIGKASTYYSVFCPVGKKLVKHKQDTAISCVPSPASIQDDLIRNKYRDKGKILHIVVVPCTEKCIEITTTIKNSNETIAISCDDFYQYIKKESIDITRFRPRKFDQLISQIGFRPEYGTAEKIFQYAGIEVRWEKDKELQDDFQLGYFNVEGKNGKVLIVKGKKAIQKMMMQTKMDAISFVEILGCSNGCCGENKRSGDRTAKTEVI